MRSEKFQKLKETVSGLLTRNTELQAAIDRLERELGLVRHENHILAERLKTSAETVDSTDHTSKRKRSGSVRKYTPTATKPDGTVELPVTFGVVTLVELGTVILDRPGFHTPRYVYPAGFTTTRSFGSMLDPALTCIYTSSIIDTGEAAPKFQVTAPGIEPIISTTCTGCWTQVLRKVNKLRGKEGQAISASGPDYFGLSNNSIAKLVQDLPNVEKCPAYNFQEVLQLI